MQDKDKKKPRISFRQKKAIVCPVCGTEFYREEMLTGRGRLIAGKLTDELRRLYEKSPKYGIIYPLAYVLNVCPKCLFTAFPKDFLNLEPDELQKIKGTTLKRLKNLYTLFPNIDFNNDRNLFIGAASYVLCVDCYGLRNRSIAPTVKRAICSIRAAWLLGDLYKVMPEYPYDKLQKFYYKKATLLYADVVELAQTGKEPFDKAVTILGPDIDKNYGYDGILYVSGILGKKYGESIFKDPKKLLNFYENVKRSLSRLFGSGKSSRNKPSDLLDMTKDLYEEMGRRIENLKEI